MVRISRMSATRILMLLTAFILLIVGVPFVLKLLASNHETYSGVLKVRFVEGNSIIPDRVKSIKCTVHKPDEIINKASSHASIEASSIRQESLLDLTSAKFRPDVTTLEATTSLEGLYDGDRTAIDGCIVIHNGRGELADGASLRGIFQVNVSRDLSALRFVVVDWHASEFLRSSGSRDSSNSDRRDFALKIELLLPGTESPKENTSFVENIFTNIDASSIATIYEPGQKLAWMPIPRLEHSGTNGLFTPLNVRVTLAETARPHEFLRWLKDVSEQRRSEAKTEIKGAAQPVAKEPPKEASNQKAIADANEAYVAYRDSWNEYTRQVASKPRKLDKGLSVHTNPTYPVTVAAWDARVSTWLQIVEARRFVAKQAFATAFLVWPGDLPTCTSATQCNLIGL